LETTVPGVQISELFPLQAQMLDKPACIRSMPTDSKHADTEIMTGYSYEEVKGLGHPSFGAGVSGTRVAKTSVPRRLPAFHLAVARWMINGCISRVSLVEIQPPVLEIALNARVRGPARGNVMASKLSRFIKLVRDASKEKAGAAHPLVMAPMGKAKPAQVEPPAVTEESPGVEGQADAAKDHVLAVIADHPELAMVVEAWPMLPGPVREESHEARNGLVFVKGVLQM
jgi:hypothetical protein